LNILLAVDGSACTKKMLAFVCAHDEWLGARHRYTVVHAVPRLPRLTTALLASDEVQTHYADEAEQVFAPIRAFFARHAIAAVYEALPGDPADAVARRADAGGFDLLLLGSHGHGRLGNLVLGSVANQIIARCRVAVLLVR